MTDLSATFEGEIAKELVKAMVGGLVGLARKVPALFRRFGKAKEQRVAADVDRFAAQLAAATGPDRERELVRQQAAWEVMLRDLLAEDPDAALELRALVAEIQRSSATTVYQQRVEGQGAGAQGPGASVTVHHHYGSDGS